MHVMFKKESQLDKLLQTGCTSTSTTEDEHDSEDSHQFLLCLHRFYLRLGNNKTIQCLACLHPKNSLIHD